MGPGRVLAPTRQRTPAGAAAPPSAAASAAATAATEGAARGFYETAAVAAAALGLCIDLYSISGPLVGLHVMEALPNSTGRCPGGLGVGDCWQGCQGQEHRLCGVRLPAALHPRHTKPCPVDPHLGLQQLKSK